MPHTRRAPHCSTIPILPRKSRKRVSKPQAFSAFSAPSKPRPLRRLRRSSPASDRSSFSSITTIVLFTRWPITRARQAPKWSLTEPAYRLKFWIRCGPDMILISPGPGRPADFGVPALVKHAAATGVPVFGVCLGLQGIVEAFGGELGVLPYPVHGKPSIVRHQGHGVFQGLPDEIEVGRYHSLYAIPERMPGCLEVTAKTDTGVIMGVRHRELPIEAVQFHPESILTARERCWPETDAQCPASRAVT